jgi:hypothetical protein
VCEVGDDEVDVVLFVHVELGWGVGEGALVALVQDDKISEVDEAAVLEDGGSTDEVGNSEGLKDVSVEDTSAAVSMVGAGGLAAEGGFENSGEPNRSKNSVVHSRHVHDH